MPTHLVLLIAALLTAAAAWPAGFADTAESSRVPGSGVLEGEVTEGFVNAPVTQVWRAFTSEEGCGSAKTAPTQSEMRIGDTICPFDASALGIAASLEHEVLAFEPERMIAVRIVQAPDALPFKNTVQQAWTVIYFAPAGVMTHVRIVGLGYGQDPRSQALREFFAKIHRAALDRLAKPYWPKCALCEKEGGATND